MRALTAVSEFLLITVAVIVASYAGYTLISSIYGVTGSYPPSIVMAVTSRLNPSLLFFNYTDTGFVLAVRVGTVDGSRIPVYVTVLTPDKTVASFNVSLFSDQPISVPDTQAPLIEEPPGNVYVVSETGKYYPMTGYLIHEPVKLAPLVTPSEIYIVSKEKPADIIIFYKIDNRYYEVARIPVTG